ncbi:MazG nucleotide pyrophosphohydrolase domain-containing protein [Corynebacterium sp. Q4381]|uniref:MazG nucleotide pyrophosphohydrolase domain-containing protein n=1 Tax=Corynebacterium sp. Marseille-Q4381 TaxID=3121597 RepID=UPI002FE5F472
MPYSKEEAAEVAEAIEEHAGDEELKKEPADVLLQVLFHVEVSAERAHSPLRMWRTRS